MLADGEECGNITDNFLEDMRFCLGHGESEKITLKMHKGIL